MKIQRAEEEKLLVVLFAVCSASGLLPVSRHHHRNESTQNNHSNCFKPNGQLLAATYLQTIFVIFCAYYTHSFNSSTATIIIILWAIHYTSSLAALLLSSQSTSQLSLLFSEACRIHSQTRKRFKSISLIDFSVMVLLIFLPVVVSVIQVSVNPDEEPFKYVLFNCSYVPLAVVELIISCLCLIAEQAHADINIQIRGVKKKATMKTFFLLKDLIERHLDVQEFVGDFARFFRLHFLNIFLTLKLRLTFYAILQVGQVTKNYSGLIIYIYPSVLVTTQVLLLCIRCHRVQEQADDTAVLVRRIQVNWLQDLTDDQSELVDYYQQLITAAKVTFSASGLFEISIPQLMNVIGLVITYSLVALQSGTIKSQ